MKSKLKSILKDVKQFGKLEKGKTYIFVLDERVIPSQYLFIYEKFKEIESKYDIKCLLTSEVLIKDVCENSNDVLTF